MPDTDENRETFGLPGTGRGQSGYPQVRLVALMALRTHLMSAVAFGPYSGNKNGEHSLAQKLWPQLPDDSLVIMDKGFIDYGLFYRLSHDDSGSVNGHKHWLVRAKKNIFGKAAPGCIGCSFPGLSMERSEIEPTLQDPRGLRRGRRVSRAVHQLTGPEQGPRLPKKMVARAIRYQVKGFRPQTVLTSMLDPEQYPAVEVTALYHERWEIEIGYDEVKTHMLERQEALRSKKAEGVRQEIWGILLAYNLVRREMTEVAEAAGVSPLQVSFRHALMLIRIFCMVEAWTCAPGNLPKRLTSHHEALSRLLILPERRPERRYKRNVKIKMSGYKRNPGKPVAKGPK